MSLTQDFAPLRIALRDGRSAMLRAVRPVAGAEERIVGSVSASNRPMLELARQLGFTVGSSEEGPSVRLARLELPRD